MKKKVKDRRGYNITLEDSVHDQARKKLLIGQRLSPIINALLKKWIKGEAEVF